MTDQTVSDIVGASIRGLREQNGWTRDELAARCARVGYAQMTAAVITNIELGKRDKDGNRRRLIAADELIVFARAFSVPASFLLPALAEGVDDLHVIFGVDDMIARLEAYREWVKSLEKRAARDIFGFKNPRSDLGHQKARWVLLESQRKQLARQLPELEREIAKTRETVERLESGQEVTEPAVVRRVRAGEPYVPGAPFEVPDEL